jgi:hypothetical protein
VQRLAGSWWRPGRVVALASGRTNISGFILTRVARLAENIIDVNKSGACEQRFKEDRGTTASLEKGFEFLAAQKVIGVKGRTNYHVVDLFCVKGDPDCVV